VRACAAVASMMPVDLTYTRAMPLVDPLSSNYRGKILDYAIKFGDRTPTAWWRRGVSEVTVETLTPLPAIPASEYIRFWASYCAKVVYNLGFPVEGAGRFAVNLLAKALNLQLTVDADCFASAGFAGSPMCLGRGQPNCCDAMALKANLRYGSSGLAAPKLKQMFNGSFEADGRDRVVMTHLPLHLSDRQVLVSVLALLQYVIATIGRDAQSLSTLELTARNMLDAYASMTRMGSLGVESIVDIPTIAYATALKQQATLQ
jgi:hypothetical protein